MKANQTAWKNSYPIVNWSRSVYNTEIGTAARNSYKTMAHLFFVVVVVVVVVFVCDRIRNEMLCKKRKMSSTY